MRIGRQALRHGRQCVADPAFRAGSHSHAYCDDHERTAPQGDPLMPRPSA